MCTVSIIAMGDGGLRLVTSRDESHDRPRALAPEWRDVAGGRAVWPTDPRAGGTWVAAGEQGLALTLLNGNPDRPAPVPTDRESRGVLIPRLISEADARSAAMALGRLDLSRFEPFRLVAADTGGAEPRVTESAWFDGRLTTRVVEAPVCFASSGLGDRLVRCRLPLFEEMVGDDPTPEAQDEFHHHRWADRPEVSVLMHRQAARTVSITTIELGRAVGGRARVSIGHRAIEPTAAG